MESTAPLIAGFTAGVASTTLLLPLDVIKVRLQVHEGQERLRALRAFRGILRYEGIRGLYVGWTPAVVGSAVSWGGYFYFYEGLKQELLAYKKDRQSALPSTSNEASTTTTTATPTPSLNSVDHFLLACTAGGIMVGLTNPIWLVKTRIQLQLKKASQEHNIRPYNGMADAFRTIIREEGLLALYKGSGPALLLTSHGGVQFVVYEYLRKHFHYQRAHRSAASASSVWERLELSTGYLTMGAIAKIIASTTTYPLQVVKSRMQQRADALEMTADGNLQAVRREYTGLTGTIRRMWQAEGITGFFKGCIPNALRVAPGAAITFVVYEGLMDVLSCSSTASTLSS
mmetsp:Transcript_2074/g.4133  ORF Transcript_2074/g.4133 Transcript_2074/m.4133 type:complete len:343 (-) Transcript_2074:135-1163(-)